jgi:hypothetical protein
MVRHPGRRTLCVAGRSQTGSSGSPDRSHGRWDSPGGGTAGETMIVRAQSWRAGACPLRTSLGRLVRCRGPLRDTRLGGTEQQRSSAPGWPAGSHGRRAIRSPARPSAANATRASSSEAPAPSAARRRRARAERVSAPCSPGSATRPVPAQRVWRLARLSLRRAVAIAVWAVALPLAARSSACYSSSPSRSSIASMSARSCAVARRRLSSTRVDLAITATLRSSSS